MGFVLHVEWVICLHRIDDDLLRKLNSESVFVDSNLLNEITASDFYARFCNKMLDNHIGHQFTISVSLLVEPMNFVKLYTVGSKATVIRSSENCLSTRVYTCSPNPVIHFANFSKSDSFLIPEMNLLVTASHNKILSSWIK